jgi:hypothetical protein
MQNRHGASERVGAVDLARPGVTTEPMPLSGGFRRAGDGRLIPPRMFREDGLDEQFWDSGMVLLPLMSPDEMDDLRVRFSRLKPFDGWDPRTVNSPRGTYHCTFLDEDRTYRRESDQLVRDVFAEKIAAVMPTYRILSSNIYVKPPGVGRFEIHQNWPTIENVDIPTLTVWVPLQDTDLKNGTIRLVPGSHHVFPDVAAATSETFFKEFEQALIETYLEPVDIPAGSALFFDDALLHWSSANRSDTPRITFQIEIVPEDAQGVLWIRNPEDETQFELWEMDKEYWIEYDVSSVYGRPEGLPFAGRRPNPNRCLTLEEFEEMMRRADEIRRSKYVLD